MVCAYCTRQENPSNHKIYSMSFPLNFSKFIYLRSIIFLRSFPCTVEHYVCDQEYAKRIRCCKSHLGSHTAHGHKLFCFYHFSFIISPHVCDSVHFYSRRFDAMLLLVLLNMMMKKKTKINRKVVLREFNSVSDTFCYPKPKKNCA